MYAPPVLEDEIEIDAPAGFSHGTKHMHSLHVADEIRIAVHPVEHGPVIGSDQTKARVTPGYHHLLILLRRPISDLVDVQSHDSSFCCILTGEISK